MQWWPFGRKKERDGPKPRSKSFGGTTRRPTDKPSAVTTPRAVSAAGQRPRPSTPPSQPPRRRSSLERATGEEPVEEQPNERYTSRENITALPQSPPNKEFERGPHLRSFDEQRRPVSSRQVPAQTALRRKTSTKTPREKKQRDRERELEIREMSQAIPIPSRSATGDAVPTRKLSRRRLSLQPIRMDRSASQVSLGSPGSIGSGMESNISSSVHHWELGALDMFSPRPKVRYSMTEYNRGRPRETTDGARSRTELQKEWRKSNRIEEIAEDLDVSTIRELMERDAQRLEKKKLAQEERARRRLERHAAKKRGEDPSAAHNGDPGEESSRAFHGLGLQGENAGPSSPVETRHRHSKKESAQQPQANASRTAAESAEGNAISNATAALTATESTGASAAPADSSASRTIAQQEASSPIKETQTESLAGGPTSAQPAVSRRTSALSQATDPFNNSTPDLTETRQGESSDQAAPELGGRRTGTLASLFRRNKRPSEDLGSKERDAPISQSSFSNTSRESMGRRALPPHLIATSPPPRRRSGVPQRTMSKFREDLPESPSSNVTPNPLDEALPPTEETGSNDASSTQPRSIPRRRAASTTSGPGHNAGNLSQSLASVDSEASWLTGSHAARQRTSRPTSPSLSTAAERHGAMLGSFEDLGKSDDEHVKQQVPSRDRAAISGGLAVDTVRENETSEHEDSNLDTPGASEGPVEYGTAARQPILVERHGSAKSREGILQQVAAEGRSEIIEGTSDYNGSGSSNESEDAKGGEHATTTAVHQAHHVRTISSGSARLLDIPTRRDSKRQSTGSNFSGQSLTQTAHGARAEAESEPAGSDALKVPASGAEA